MKDLIRFLVLPVLTVGVLSAASITVTKPALNEPWDKGQSHTIIWTKNGDMPDKVRITLRNATTLAEVAVIVDPAPNTGSYQWLVPASTADGQYRIRVKVKNVAVQDDSKTFSIIASQQPLQAPLKTKANAALAPLTTPIKPSLKVEFPAGDAACSCGNHLYIRFSAHTMPGDAIDIDLWNDSKTKGILSIHSGTYGVGTSIPPAGPNYPNQYIYDWVVPFDEDVIPGYYRIRLYSQGTKLTAWSGRVYLAWPMKEREYWLEATINRILCVNSYDGLTPPPVRPKCENPLPANHAIVGFDVFDYPGSIKWTDGEVHQYWRVYIRYSQLKFPIEQFQGKKVKLIQAKLYLKKECTVSANSNLASCAGRLYRLDAAPPGISPSPTLNQCLGMKKTALVFLPNDLAENSYNVNQSVEYWINKTVPNYGFLLSVANETPPLVAATCISGYSVKLYLKIEEEYKGYTIN